MDVLSPQFEPRDSRSFPRFNLHLSVWIRVEQIYTARTEFKICQSHCNVVWRIEFDCCSRMAAEAVKVIVRCRPMNQRENSLNCKNVVNIDTKIGQCSIHNPSDAKAPPKTFTFDGAYGCDSTTEQIYADIGYPLVEVRILRLRFTLSVLLLDVTCIFHSPGSHWGIQWHDICLWSNWMWEVLQYAGHYKSSYTKGHYSQVDLLSSV